MGKLAFITSRSFGSDGLIRVLPVNSGFVIEPFQGNTPAFDPSGKKILFCKSTSMGSAVHVFDSSLQASMVVTHLAESSEDAAWSPDGTQIVLSVWPEDRKSARIFSIRADGGNARELTRGKHYDWGPRWSPDGKKILFESTRDGNREVYVMNADGTNPINLTSNPAVDHAPAWSPDGQHIAWMSRAENGKASIWLMRADGSEKVNVTKAKGRDSEPTWSPDGRWLAFTRIADEADDKQPMDIWICKIDGTAQRPVTWNDRGTCSYHPSWGK
jgi:TolB protein